MESEIRAKEPPNEEKLHSNEAQIKQILEYFTLLRGYNAGELGSDAIANTPIITKEASMMLCTEKGKKFLQDWLDAFGAKITLAQEMIEVDAILSTDEEQLLEGLKAMAKSIERRMY